MRHHWHLINGRLVRHTHGPLGVFRAVDLSISALIAVLIAPTILAPAAILIAILALIL